MVVEHDDVRTALSKPADGFNRSRAAIDGEQQPRWKFFQAVFHTVLAQAVALIHPVRQIKIRLPAEPVEDFEQQRSGRDAVHVVIAKNDKRLAAFACLPEALHGGLHVWQQERIGKLLEARVEKVFDGHRLAESAIEQALREQRRNSQVGCEPPGEQRLRRSR